MPPPATPPLRCLVSLQSFETYWAYYVQSDALLYPQECKAAAREWVAAVTDVLREDPALGESLADEILSEQPLDELLQIISSWAGTDAGYPFESPGRSRFVLFSITSSLKARLHERLGLPAIASAEYSFDEMDFQRRQLMWGAHLSKKLIAMLPENVPEILSQSDSIVVIGDIRKSQDLMTYGPDAAFFSRNMLAFLNTTRQLLVEYDGVFDKFTGDGFLAYFNADICARAGRDHRECFLAFARALTEFSTPHFEQWARSLRKHPADTIGVGIGADIGRVTFRHDESVLFAVGDAIVWAERMCSKAGAGELMVNNLLAGRLSETMSLPFEKTVGQTKAGETFLGYRLQL